MPQDTLLRFFLQLWLLLSSLLSAVTLMKGADKNCWVEAPLSALVCALPWLFLEVFALPVSLVLLVCVQMLFGCLHKTNGLHVCCIILLSGWLWTFFLLLLPLVPVAITLVLPLLLCLSICLIVWKFHKKEPDIVDYRQSGILLIWLSTLLVLFLFLLWNGWLIRHGDSFSIKDARVLVLVTAIAFSLCLCLLRALLRAAQFKMETLLDRQFQQELESFMQVIRGQRHDFNFHVQALSGMLEAQRYEECHAYMQTLVKSVNHLNQVLPLHHPAVSALFNTFQEIAFRQNIRMELRIENSLARIPCTVLEINTIIGNLLQNAIDETSQLESSQRYIRVLVVKRGAKNVIKVSNPHHLAEEDFRHVFEAGHSTKEGHQGIGLSTVKRLVLRCQGTVHTEFEEGVVHFIVQLPIPLDS